MCSTPRALYAAERKTISAAQLAIQMNAFYGALHAAPDKVACSFVVSVFDTDVSASTTRVDVVPFNVLWWTCAILSNCKFNLVLFLLVGFVAGGSVANEVLQTVSQDRSSR